MNTKSDIYPKIANLTPSDLLAAMRVFPASDNIHEEGATMTWQRHSEWEGTARELTRICRTLVLEARGLDLGALKEAHEQYQRLIEDLRTACKKALHCGTGMHSGTDPEHVFPINIQHAEVGNAIKFRLDAFNKAFKKEYGKLFRSPEYLDGHIDFDVLTELPKPLRADMAAVLTQAADEDGEVEHADPVTEVPVALQGLFP